MAPGPDRRRPLVFAGGTLASGVLLLARYVNLPRSYDFSLLLAMTLIA